MLAPCVVVVGTGTGTTIPVAVPITVVPLLAPPVGYRGTVTMVLGLGLKVGYIEVGMAGTSVVSVSEPELGVIVSAMNGWEVVVEGVETSVGCAGVLMYVLMPGTFVALVEVSVTGHTVVLMAIVSVVTEPTGQLVTEAGHLVTVATRVE